MANPLTSFCTAIYKQYAQDPAKALLHLGTLGFFSSAAAQLVMINKNKDFDKEQKKFLTNQETADCVVNVGLYYTMTDAAKRLADHLVESGTIRTKKTDTAIRAFAEKMHVAENDSSFKTILKDTFKNLKAGSQIDKKSADAKGMLGKVYKGAIRHLSNMENSDKLSTQLKEAKADFKDFKSGVGVFAAVGISIVAASIIAPIVRNKVANHMHKKNEDLPNPVPVDYLRNRPVFSAHQSSVYSSFKI
ncbi:hypothetical protein tpqmel_0857 [Candidatus Gastranaerophilus sp. (ex Termes propinquus)]|nr:hypothetical protein tpqmel_0857 [Candidatus Gastranaerophilus sp. (ex Termes propinquus)]